MIGRRHVLTAGGLFGAMSATMLAGTGNTPASAVGQPSERASQEIIQALKDIGAAIDAQQSSSEIRPVKQRMLDFLKAEGKFPDYMEVGIDHWMAAYDWHVKHLRPITIERDANGRYQLVLMFTRLVLRPEAAPTLIGTPFDNR